MQAMMALTRGAKRGRPRLLFCAMVAAAPANGSLGCQTAAPRTVAVAGSTTSPVFIVAPYLQLGDAPAVGRTASMTLMWHTDTVRASWVVEVRASPTAPWSAVDSITTLAHTFAAPGIAPHLVHESELALPAAGRPFDYRVRRNGTIVFSASAIARKGPTDPYRFVVFGDCGLNSPGQRAVAYQTYLQNPDLVAIAGDIVYRDGTMSHYRTEYYPIYNADSASPEIGAPLARHIPFVAAVGNHDAGWRYAAGSARDFWGFYAYWSLPLNGPSLPPYRVVEGIPPDAENFPRLQDDSALRPGDGFDPVVKYLRYPRMSNYSFDFGDSHWLVLDANKYMNWTDLALRSWVARDLNASTATWKFVMFHQPGFNSALDHFREQQMRVLADVFERYGVAIVFSGHEHNYQRSYPLTFVPDFTNDPKRGPDGRLRQPYAYPTPSNTYLIDGVLTLDRQFDGVHHTVPRGVIYVVTGAGGAWRYDPQLTNARAQWQPFTRAFVADRFSLSVVDVDHLHVAFRQIDASGQELDRFTISKRDYPDTTGLTRVKIEQVTPAP